MGVWQLLAIITLLFVGLFLGSTWQSNREANKGRSQQKKKQYKPLLWFFGDKKQIKINQILKEVFEGSEDPVCIYDQHYTFIWGNRAFAEAVGVPYEQISDKCALDVMTPARLARHKLIDKPVLDDGKMIRYEDFFIKSNGTTVWYELTKTQFVDSVNKDVGIVVVARDITEHKNAQHELAEAVRSLEELSYIDGLTQVANRRSFDEQLTKMWNAHTRSQASLSLIICDIDWFKLYNDSYGHQKGDEALRQTAEVFVQSTRRSLDFVARYGGEEFAIILPNTDENGAKHISQLIAQKLAKKNIRHECSLMSDRLTLSQGIATLCPLPNQDHRALVELADKALYQAKNEGRNRAVVYCEAAMEIDYFL